MMILPLADALQNCLQNLTSRIAGVDNEQMTGRVMGMGAMLGFGLGAIKEQFNSPSTNIKTGNSNSSSNGGLKGFVDRAKSVINPNLNLSDAKDYNGNVNPIRDVLTKEKVNNTTSIPTSNGINKENMSNGNKITTKSVAKNIAKTGFNATKTYLDIGAKMAEGDFNKSPYKSNGNNKKANFQKTEYINKVANTNNAIKNLGDENEPKA
jgi:hypothetical protein